MSILNSLLIVLLLFSCNAFALQNITLIIPPAANIQSLRVEIIELYVGPVTESIIPYNGVSSQLHLKFVAEIPAGVEVDYVVCVYSIYEGGETSPACELFTYSNQELCQ